MDNSILEIRYNYGHGRMFIEMENFFPTTKARLKKLLKVIALDWEHEADLIQQIKTHIEEKIPIVEDERQQTGKKHLNYRQLIADREQEVKSKKHPNGVPLTKDELKQKREALKDFREEAAFYLRIFKACQRKKEQYSELLEYLKTV